MEPRIFNRFKQYQTNYENVHEQLREIMNTQSIAPVRVNRDGSPDKRFKANKTPNPGTANTQEVQKEAPEWTYALNANGYTFQNKSKAIIHTTALSISGASISCGVRQLSNVSSLSRAVAIGVPRPLVMQALSEFIVKCKKDNKSAYLIVSNNDRAKESNDMIKEIAVTKTEYRRNPNSGNPVFVAVL